LQEIILKKIIGLILLIKIYLKNCQKQLKNQLFPQNQILKKKTFTTTTTSTSSSNSISSPSTGWGVSKPEKPDSKPSSKTEVSKPDPPPSQPAQNSMPTVKQEEEYIKNKEQTQIAFELKKEKEEKIQENTDLVHSKLSIDIVGFHTKEEKKEKYTVFEIQIEFLAGSLRHSTVSSQSWTIFRRFGQFSDLVGRLNKHGVKFGSSVLPIDKDPEVRKQGLASLLQFLLKNRDQVFANKNSTYGFLSFIAPVQMGDKKPNGFLMPFDLTPPK